MSRPVETHQEAVERLVQSAVEQGYGRHVTDAVVLDRIVGVVLGAPPRRRPQRADGPGPSERRGRRVPQTDPTYLLHENGHGPG